MQNCQYVLVLYLTIFSNIAENLVAKLPPKWQI